MRKQRPLFALARISIGLTEHPEIREAGTAEGKQPHISAGKILHSETERSSPVDVSGSDAALRDDFRAADTVLRLPRRHFRFRIVGEGLAAFFIHPQPGAENQPSTFRLDIEDNSLPSSPPSPAGSRLPGARCRVECSHGIAACAAAAGFGIGEKWKARKMPPDYVSACRNCSSISNALFKRS